MSSVWGLRCDRRWIVSAFFAAFAATGRLGGAVAFFAVGDIPTAALEVNSRSAHLALNIAAFASSAGGRTCLDKRNTFFKVCATVMANKFIDWHFAKLPTVSTNDKFQKIKFINTEKRVSNTLFSKDSPSLLAGNWRTISNLSEF